jgi:hypothetical protein
MRRSYLVALAAAFSCVRTAAVPCGDDLCPIGYGVTCANDHCVDTTLVTSCNGIADNGTCNLGAGGSGTCQNGICIVGYCGDGMINGTEDCDGTDLGGQTCVTLGGSQGGGVLACGSDCKFNLAGCSSYCGNMIVDPGEQCDGTNLDSKSCTDYGFYGGTLTCSTTCQVDLGMCSGRCGDGMIEGFERCDGTNLNGQTCATLGYQGSGMLPLTCGSDCTFSASSCTCGGVLCGSNEQCVPNGPISSCEPL